MIGPWNRGTEIRQRLQLVVFEKIDTNLMDCQAPLAIGMGTRSNFAEACLTTVNLSCQRFFLHFKTYRGSVVMFHPCKVATSITHFFAVDITTIKSKRVNTVHCTAVLPSVALHVAGCPNGNHGVSCGNSCQLHWGKCKHPHLPVELWCPVQAVPLETTAGSQANYEAKGMNLGFLVMTHYYIYMEPNWTLEKLEKPNYSNPGTPWRTEYPQVICGCLRPRGRWSVPGRLLQWELWQLVLALICRCLVVRTSWWIVHIKIAKRGNEKKGICQPTWRLLRCILKEVFIGNFSEAEGDGLWYWMPGALALPQLSLEAPTNIWEHLDSVTSVLGEFWSQKTRSIEFTPWGLSLPLYTTPVLWWQVQMDAEALQKNVKIRCHFLSMMSMICNDLMFICNYIVYVSIHLYSFIFEFCFDFVGDVAKCGHSVSAAFGRFSLRLWEPLARRGLFVWAMNFPCPPFFDWMKPVIVF